MRFRAASLVLALFLALGLAAGAWAQDPVRVGSAILNPTRLKDVKPVYPEIARTAMVEGVVILELKIDAAGKVTDAKVLKSIALLDEAALEAVRQWEFAPAHLNGQAVPIILTATVNFRLRGAYAAPVAAFDPGVRDPLPQPDTVVSLDRPIRVGGGIQAPTRTKFVAPIYPPEAQQAKVSGVVILEVMISANGSVAFARVLKSVPELDQAATDAVMQWEYTPTKLNGLGVPVIMTVTVSFSLQ